MSDYNVHVPSEQVDDCYSTLAEALLGQDDTIPDPLVVIGACVQLLGNAAALRFKKDDPELAWKSLFQNPSLRSSFAARFNTMREAVQQLRKEDDASTH